MRRPLLAFDEGIELRLVVRFLVDHVVFLGAHQHVRVRTAEAQRIEVLASNDAKWRQGDTVTVEWHPNDSVVVRSGGVPVQTSEYREEERT